MKTKTINERYFTIEEVIEALVKTYNLDDDATTDVRIDPINKIKDIGGIDPHDSHHITIFNGIRITITKEGWLG